MNCWKCMESLGCMSVYCALREYAKIHFYLISFYYLVVVAVYFAFQIKFMPSSTQTSSANNHSNDDILPKMKPTPRLLSQTPTPAPIINDNTFVSNNEYKTSRENSEFLPTRANRMEQPGRRFGCWKFQPRINLIKKRLQISNQ